MTRNERIEWEKEQFKYNIECIYRNLSMYYWCVTKVEEGKDIKQYKEICENIHNARAKLFDLDREISDYYRDLFYLFNDYQITFDDQYNVKARPLYKSKEKKD